MKICELRSQLILSNEKPAADLNKFSWLNPSDAINSRNSPPSLSTSFNRI